ncbi:hypothetical protein PRUPE_6G103300 [Prunus persica]|uniref:Uncharacterized protein n=1 Tax=Prunus persica TaxID=3760 RepID=A0A251NN65_PRUPE|nr:hypothetical protein PRUPE_6G103300 [Prunus persica]
MSTDEIVVEQQTSEVTNINTLNPHHPEAAGVLSSTSHAITIPSQTKPTLSPSAQGRAEEKAKEEKEKAEKAEKEEKRLPLTLAVLVGLATVLFVIGINPASYAKPEFDNVVSRDSQCKPHDCPCCPFFVIVSLFLNIAITLVWWLLLLMCRRFPYNGILWGILFFVWAIYWIILRAKIPLNFWKPTCGAFSSLLLLLLLLRIKAQPCWEPIKIFMMKHVKAFWDKFVCCLFGIPCFVWNIYEVYKER